MAILRINLSSEPLRVDSRLGVAAPQGHFFLRGCVASSARGVHCLKVRCPVLKLCGQMRTLSRLSRKCPDRTVCCHLRAVEEGRGCVWMIWLLVAGD